MQTTPADYDLGDQIGFVLRRAFQRHTAIFQSRMVEALTPTQFAAMVRLADVGPCSQNLLGRLTAMDVATIKGVIDRLRSRGLVASVPDETDRRRSSLTLTPDGRRLLAQAIEAGRDITRETLSALDPQEQRQLLNLLGRITD